VRFVSVHAASPGSFASSPQSSMRYSFGNLFSPVAAVGRGGSGGVEAGLLDTGAAFRNEKDLRRAEGGGEATLVGDGGGWSGTAGWRWECRALRHQLEILSRSHMHSRNAERISVGLAVYLCHGSNAGRPGRRAPLAIKGGRSAEPAIAAQRWRARRVVEFGSVGGGEQAGARTRERGGAGCSRRLAIWRRPSGEDC
jgi:hypothetical protein